MASDSYYQQRQLRLYEESYDPWDPRENVPSDDDWYSDDDRYYESVLDEDHGFDNPIYYGVNSTHMRSSNANHAARQNFTLNTAGRDHLNKESWPFGFEGIRLRKPDPREAEDLGIPDGYWECWDRAMTPIIVEFPQSVFEIDSKMLRGYILDLPSFSYWLYYWRQKCTTLCDISTPWRLYSCLYSLGENEVKGRSMVKRGSADLNLQCWLRQCSHFARLLHERVDLCYGRVPTGGTDIYPGVLIANYFFGPQSLNWMTEYIKMIDRSNGKFAIEFEQGSRGQQICLAYRD